MADMPDIQSAAAAMATPFATQAGKVLRQAGSSSGDDQKIEKAGKDFESLLLTNWLQHAYESFGSVPGGDDDDEDSGKGQFQGIAMEALGQTMSAWGGIGIAKMVSQHLQKTENHPNQAKKA